jgi:ankyrin repeat protein
MFSALRTPKALLATWVLLCLHSLPSLANPELLQAAESGDLPAVQAQLENGADVNFTVENKTPKWGHLVQTPLENASSMGHPEVVALLIEQGAKPRSNPWYGFYAATWAGQGGHAEVLTQLLAAFNTDKTKLNDLFGPALINAARNGRPEAVAVLLESGVSPNWHTPGDAFPRPAIQDSMRAGQEAIFTTLLDAGADPKPYPEILTLAASRGNVDMVKRLLDMGMDPNAKNEFGQPLPMTACSITSPGSEGRQRINATAAMLMEANAKVNASARGRSALFCAEEDKNEELVAMLQANGGKSFETAGRKLKRLGLGVLFGLGNH